MKLYLIRHGQSEANIGHYFSGQTQVELTEEGQNQARYLGRIINNIPFDKIYSSDLHRAIDTQKLALPNAECEITSLLREIDVGCLAGIHLTECLKIYGETLINNRGNYDFTPYGGENCNMVKNRFRSFLDIISNKKHKTIAAFSHGAYIVAAIEQILGIELDKRKVETKNCSITVLEQVNGKWMLDLYNYTGQL